MKKRPYALSVTIIMVLTLSFLSVGSVFAASPEGNPGKGPSDFEKIIFVHYPQGIPAKGGLPGQGKPGGDSDKAWYKYSGYHWADANIPVYYRVNSNVSATFLAGIQAAFQTWEDDPNSYIDFECDAVGFDGLPSSLIGDGFMNGANEVVWTSLSADYPHAIAVTIVWRNIFTGLIAEVDMAMNSDFAWSQANLPDGTDPDRVTGDPSSYDVQNIATHEAGHWLMLGDLYNKPTADQTMYGIGAKGELKKRSLESGDIAGLQLIYSGAVKP
jgi:hypothetical protein